MQAKEGVCVQAGRCHVCGMWQAGVARLHVSLVWSGEPL